METENTFNGLPLVLAEMDEEKFTHGTNFLSLVDMPATKQPVFLFKDQTNGSQRIQTIEDSLKFASIDSKRGIITGVVMLADHPIKRCIGEGDDCQEFYLQFPADVVEKMAFKFMKNLFGQNVNIDHDPKQHLHDTYVVESYLFDPTRGRTLDSYMNSDEVNPGSWIVSFMSESKQVLQDIADGKLFGISLEGDFGMNFNFGEDFVGINKSIILDANLSVEDKFNHIKKTIGDV